MTQPILELVRIDNILGQGTRRETLMGRRYIVASVTMIVPGVLNGSGGPLLYRPERVATMTATWNGMPLVLEHPFKDGQPVSARSPGILEAQGIGMVFHSQFNNTLRAEAWFDEEMTAKKAPRVLSLLEAGKPIEVSTGLYLSRTKVDDGAVHNGKPYTYDTDNYQPDHLAVLMNGKGACSNDDGCGINNGSNLTPANGDVMNKEQKIQWLTTNCSCWKDKSEVLNKMEDPALDALVESGKATIQINQRFNEQSGILKVVATLLGVEHINNSTEVDTLLKAKITPVTPSVVTPVVNTPKIDDQTKPKNFAEALKLYGTSEDLGTWNAAQRISVNEKNRLLDRICNAMGKNDQAKAQLRELYSKQSIENLEIVANNLPEVPVTNDPTPRYLPDFGNYGQQGLAINQEDTLLPTSAYND